MFDTGGHKQNVVRNEVLARTSADKLTVALGDDVNLVTRMRRLRIAAARRVELHDQRAVLEQQHGLLALRAGQTFQRFAEFNLLKGIGRCHGDDGNNTLQCAAQSRVVMAMDKDELMELAGNPEFISGIYNYCDRWCERCQFTSRCLLYATEQADSDFDDPEVRDINNEKFWKKLQSIFKNTAEMMAQWAAEAGVDLDSIDTEAALEEHKREIDEAKQSELSQAAKRYAMTVETWFKEEFATEEDVHDDAAITPEPNEVDLSRSGRGRDHSLVSVLCRGQDVPGADGWGPNRI